MGEKPREDRSFWDKLRAGQRGLVMKELKKETVEVERRTVEEERKMEEEKGKMADVKAKIMGKTAFRTLVLIIVIAALIVLAYYLYTRGYLSKAYNVLATGIEGINTYLKSGLEKIGIK